MAVFGVFNWAFTEIKIFNQLLKLMSEKLNNRTNKNSDANF